MKTRTDLLNHLIEKYKLLKYLEIGVQDPRQNFDKVNCRYKMSVDPDREAGATFVGTSDEYFDRLFNYKPGDRAKYFNTPNGLEKDPLSVFEVAEDFVNNKLSCNYFFDLIFIDGLHTADQVKKDFQNALKILSPNGFIVLHDCNPEKEEHTIVPRPSERGHWNGDVYKFALSLPREDCLDVETIDIDNGCMVIRLAAGTRVYCEPGEIIDIPWAKFDKNRSELLNLISWDDFVSI
jgi:SAM-dependent methyltransferase